MSSAKKTSEQDEALFTLSNLLSLTQRVKSVTHQELRFIIANETHNVLSYDQAVFWEFNGNHFSVAALSGVSEIDKNSAYLAYLRNIWSACFSDIGDITIFSKDSFQESDIAQEWGAHHPEQVLFIPIKDQLGQKIGALLLARKIKWQDNHIAIATKISEIYSHEIVSHFSKKTGFFTLFNKAKKSRVKYIALLCLLLILFYPARLSVLAPAEVIAFDPDLVRSPIEGIIEDIKVKPNERVTQGQSLVAFDQRVLMAQKEVSENALIVAQAELRQVSQEAMSDHLARSKLSALRGKVEKEKTNLAYYNDLIDRSVLKAPRDGIVVFDDVFDWIGRPVAVGERIMLLADNEKTQVEIRLPVIDAIPLEEGSDILFFSNARPDIPLKATLSFHSFRANQTPEGAVAYRLKADWETYQNLDNKRLGLKGTAKIYGQRQSLFMQIFRKPFVKIRQFLGV